jgi:plastocyanin
LTRQIRVKSYLTNLLHLLILGLAGWSIFLILQGCSAGDFSDTPYTGETGTFKVRARIPARSKAYERNSLLNTSSRFHHSGSRVIPEGSYWLRVEIVEAEVSSALPLSAEVEIDEEVTLSLDNVPVGLNTAHIKILNEDKTRVLAQRKHGFFLGAGGTVSPGVLDMGVAITEHNEVTGKNTYVPDKIKIQPGDTLYFENWTLGSRSVTFHGHPTLKAETFHHPNLLFSTMNLLSIIQDPFNSTHRAPITIMTATQAHTLT